MGQRHAADSVQAGQLNGALGAEVRIEISGASVSVPALQGAQGEREGGACVDVDIALVDERCV